MFVNDIYGNQYIRRLDFERSIGSQRQRTYEAEGKVRQRKKQLSELNRAHRLLVLEHKELKNKYDQSRKDFEALRDEHNRFVENVIGARSSENRYL